MASRPQNWFEGWRLFAVLTLTLIGLCVWIAGMRQFEVDGVRMVIRFTARTSLLLFCLAFALPRWRGSGPTRWTRWQRRNRRYLGVSFAASHGLHAVAIAVLSRRWIRRALPPPPAPPPTCSAASAMPSSSR